MNPNVYTPPTDLAAMYCTIGRMEIDSGRLDDAVHAYARAATVDPSLAEAFDGLSESHRLAGRLGAARAARRRSQELRLPRPTAASLPAASLETRELVAAASTGEIEDDDAVTVQFDEPVDPLADAKEPAAYVTQPLELPPHVRIVDGEPVAV